jgi:hypothetical protein
MQQDMILSSQPKYPAKHYPINLFKGKALISFLSWLLRVPEEEPSKQATSSIRIGSSLR